MTEVILANLGDVAFVLLGVLACVVLAVAGWLLLKLAKFILGKFGIQLSDAQLNSIQGVITSVVKFLNQKIVNGLKAANPDGKLTDEQAQEIHNKAINLITNSLSEDQKKVLTDKFGDFDTALDILTEAAVADNHVSSEEIGTLLTAELDTTK